MSAQPLGFLPRPPLERAREIADRDVKGRTVSAEELHWLHSHPLTWTQALDTMKEEVESHLAKLHRGLSHLRPEPGTSPSAAYLAAKRETDRREVGMLHFLQRVNSRRAAVLSLIGYDSKRLSDAGICASLLRIESLLERGDSDQALAMLHALLDRAEAQR